MSYTHKLSNMSSTWIFIFGVGNTIGAMSMQPIGTMLVFSDNPLSFMWLLTGLALTALLSFIGMYLLGYKYGPLPQGKSFSHIGSDWTHFATKIKKNLPESSDRTFNVLSNINIIFKIYHKLCMIRIVLFK